MTTAKSNAPNSSASRETVRLMGRAGYAARGVIYLLVGVSAAQATFDPHHRPGGFTEALEFLQQHWTGGVVLTLLAIGMACFAGWLAMSAVYRRDRSGPVHWVLVAGLIGDAAVYLGFMVSLLGMIFGSSGGNEYLMQSWVRWLIAGIGGRAIVGFAGAAVFACGGGLVAWGAAGDIEGPLELPSTEKQLMLPIGRYGTVGRGMAIVLVGCYLLASALHGDPSQAHELGGVIRELRAFPGGIVITAAFALAFIGSGVLDFVIAAYRRFDPPQSRVRTRRRT